MPKIYINRDEFPTASFSLLYIYAPPPPTHPLYWAVLYQIQVNSVFYYDTLCTKPVFNLGSIFVSLTWNVLL